MTDDKPRKQPVSPGSDELFRFVVESVRDYAIFATDAAGRVTRRRKIAPGHVCGAVSTRCAKLL